MPPALEGVGENVYGPVFIATMILWLCHSLVQQQILQHYETGN